MKKSLFILLAFGLLVISCNTGPLTSGPDQQTYTSLDNNRTYTITPASLCRHNLSSFRGEIGAEVIDAPSGTVYECTSTEVHECTGGENIATEHFVDNTQSEEFTLELKSGFEFYFDTNGSLVTIENPIGLLFWDAGENDWAPLTDPGVYTLTALKTTGNGSANISTTDVVIVNKSGMDQNG